MSSTKSHLDIDPILKAIDEIDRSALEKAISHTNDEGKRDHTVLKTVDPYAEHDPVAEPPKQRRRGRHKMRASPFVKLFLWYRYPKSGAPGSVHALHQHLKKPGNQLAARFGFPDRVPDRKTIDARFKELALQEDLVTKALRAIYITIPDRPYLIPPEWDPQPDTTKPGRRRGRRKESELHQELVMKQALGQEEFNHRFPNEAACDDFLLEKLHGNHMQCRKCWHKRCHRFHVHGVSEIAPYRHPHPDPAEYGGDADGDQTRRQWKCRCCGYNATVTSGTLLHSANLPLKTIVRCIYATVHERHGMSSRAMTRDLHLPGRPMHTGTINFLRHRLRIAMVQTHPPFEGPIEIDDARVKLKDAVVFVLGAYDHSTRRVCLEAYDQPINQAIMRDFILRVTVPGSRIYTDGTAAYPPGLDRKRFIVLHNKFEFARGIELDLPHGDKESIYIMTNHIEGGWRFLRRVLRNVPVVSRTYFELYLQEIQWRISRLHNRRDVLAYDGPEKRELALMGELVANLSNYRITIKSLQNGGWRRMILPIPNPDDSTPSLPSKAGPARSLIDILNPDPRHAMSVPRAA